MIEEFLNMTRWASEDKFSFVKGKSNYRVHTLNLKGVETRSPTSLVWHQLGGRRPRE